MSGATKSMVVSVIVKQLSHNGIMITAVSGDWHVGVFNPGEGGSTGLTHAKIYHALAGVLQQRPETWRKRLPSPSHMWGVAVPLAVWYDEPNIHVTAPPLPRFNAYISQQSNSPGYHPVLFRWLNDELKQAGKPHFK